MEAHRGQMDLLQADILLQQIACYLDVWPVLTMQGRASIRDQISDGLEKAAHLMTTIGYGRRQAMLASLQETAVKAGILG